MPAACGWALVHHIQDQDPEVAYTWLDQLDDGKGDFREYNQDMDIYLVW